MKRKSVIDIINMKASSKKITALTCYDNAIARILGLTDLDIILIGRLPRYGIPRVSDNITCNP